VREDKKTRDRRFVAGHRGGPLGKEQHYKLMRWACRCAEHVMPLCGEKVDDRLIHALHVAKVWTEGKATVGEARKASVESLAVAQEAPTPTTVAVARAVGHAVATAHMADHALRAALYALKATRSASQSVEEEIEWQERQLPAEIKDLVLTAREGKMGNASTESKAGRSGRG
jgi:hypothetical protein